MKTLKTAREEGRLDKFIKEHEADPPGDLNKLDKLITSVARGTGSKAPKASSQDASDD